jgi:hypothetical protein
VFLEIAHSALTMYSVMHNRSTSLSCAWDAIAPIPSGMGPRRSASCVNVWGVYIRNGPDSANENDLSSLLSRRFNTVSRRAQDTGHRQLNSAAKNFVASPAQQITHLMPNSFVDQHGHVEPNEFVGTVGYVRG